MNRDQLDTQFDMIWYIFSHEASEPNLWLGQTVWARNIAGLKIRASNPTRTFGMPPGPTGRLFGPSPKAKRARLRFDKSTDHRSWTSPSFHFQVLSTWSWQSWQSWWSWCLVRPSAYLLGLGCSGDLLTSSENTHAWPGDEFCAWRGLHGIEKRLSQRQESAQTEIFSSTLSICLSFPVVKSGVHLGSPKAEWRICLQRLLDCRMPRGPHVNSCGRKISIVEHTRTI